MKHNYLFDPVVLQPIAVIRYPIFVFLHYTVRHTLFDTHNLTHTI
jgi:hypothetical protein